MSRNFKWLGHTYLCLCTRLPCKVVSEFIAFSRQINKPKDKRGTCKEPLAVLEHTNDLKPFNPPLTLEIVKERENVALDNDTLLRYTAGQTLPMVFNGELDSC